MKKMFVGNLPAHTTEQTIKDLFGEYGTVRSIELASDIFTRKCRGFGFVEMEGHEARAAIAGLNGKFVDGKNLRVTFDEARGKRKGRRR